MEKENDCSKHNGSLQNERKLEKERDKLANLFMHQACCKLAAGGKEDPKCAITLCYHHIYVYTCVYIQTTYDIYFTSTKEISREKKRN